MADPVSIEMAEGPNHNHGAILNNIRTDCPSGNGVRESRAVLEG